jgi:ADP-ribose pyrophosphatase
MTDAPEHDDAPLREERIAGRRVYAGHVVTLDVDRVRFADGTEATREVVRHPGAVVVVALTARGEVVLERQFRYAAAEVLLELPAGKLDGGEPPLACAQRELAEETGFSASEWRPLGTFFTAPGFADERMHAFLALGAERSAVCALDEDERLEVVLVPFERAVALVRSGEIHDAKSIVGLLLAQIER